MNFLHYVLFWLVGKASAYSKWITCRNNTSGSEGICLPEILCIRMDGLSIETCTSSTANNICCKILYVRDNEVKNASRVNLSDIISNNEEIKTDSTSSLRHSVLLASFNQLQNIESMDSVVNQLNDFERNYSLEQDHEISKNEHPQKVNQSYHSDSFWLSERLDPKLKNFVRLQSEQYPFKYVTKDPYKIPYKYFSGSQKLRGKNSKSKFQKLVKKVLLVNKSSAKEYKDLRNSVWVNVTDYLLKSVKTDSTFYLQKPVQISSSETSQNKVLTSREPNQPKIVKETTTRYLEHPIKMTVDYDFRNTTQNQPTNDIRTFYSQQPASVHPSHNLHRVVKASDSHKFRWAKTQEIGQDLQSSEDIPNVNFLSEPARADSTFHLQKFLLVNPSHNPRKTVKVSESHDLRWPVVQELDHNLRRPVQVHATNDLRKPVQVDSSFYLQKPVQVDSSFYLQKPVQVDSTFYLQKPVQVDSSFHLQKPVQVHSSHDLRKAVKVADSHDLRWPVVQEPDHDLQNTVADIDYFRSENEETKLNKIIQGYANNTHKDGNLGRSHDPIYELLYEDERLKSNCEHEVWSWNNSENRTRLENLGKDFQQNILFRNSTKKCGIPYHESSDNLDFQEINTNMGPWMVSVQEYFFGKFRHKCGGSLLNNLWVVTAAHCVDLRPKWDFLLKFRSDNEESHKSIERLVNKISIHPKYNNINFDNDIALLRMEQPVIFQSNIVPICLPDGHERMEKRKAVIFGWKVAERRETSSGETQVETVPVLTNKECEVMFSETGVAESIEKNFVCAGARSAKESCTGDSGGPLAILDTRGRWSLAGLYSWGKSCKIPNQPEVYISIKSYVNWIEDTITCFEHYINLSKTN